MNVPKVKYKYISSLECQASFGGGHDVLYVLTKPATGRSKVPRRWLVVGEETQLP